MNILKRTEAEQFSVMMHEIILTTLLFIVPLNLLYIYTNPACVAQNYKYLCILWMVVWTEVQMKCKIARLCVVY